MKKFISLLLICLLLILPSCAISGGEKPSSTKNTETSVNISTEDDKIKRINDYIESRTFLEYLLLVERAENKENKLNVTIAFKTVEIYKLGQLIADCAAAVKTALENENEKLNELLIRAEFQNNNAVMYVSSDFETGVLTDSMHSDMDGKIKSIDEFITFYSAENKNLVVIKPEEEIDYFEVVNIDKSTLPPEYIEIAEYINKQIPKARFVYTELGQTDPDKLHIYVMVYRETSQEMGEIAKQAVEATKHAITLTTHAFEQLSIFYNFFDNVNKFEDFQWGTSNFTDGYVWDERNPHLIPPDGRDMSYEEVITFYTPQNADLK